MTVKAKRQFGNPLSFETLEDQVLYSADALGGLDTTLSADKDKTILSESVLPGSRFSDVAPAQPPPSQEIQAAAPVYEVVFIDTHTANYQLLIDDLLQERSDERRIDIFLLEDSSDGIKQISDALANYDSLDAVHIISHGFDGAIDIGSTRLDASVLTANRADIASWGDAFDETGDLLIYGCDLATTEDGQRFIDSLASITRTDVAASIDLTGHALLGGDWDLEYRHGDIEHPVALSMEMQRSWVDILAPGLTPIGNETLVNGSAASTQTTTPFGGGNVAMDANGNYAVVWEDTRSVNLDTYLQIYNADGSIRVSEFVVHSANASNQDWPNVAMTDAGNVIVTWSDDRSGNYESYMRLFDIDGVALTAETQVSTVAGVQDAHSIDTASDGSFVIVFQSASTTDIYMQRYDANGIAQGVNTRVNGTTGNTQHHPTVAVADDGSYVVTWMSNGQDGSGEGMYRQRFTAAGVAVDPEFQINQVTADDQWYGNVANDAAGNFVVTWMSNNQDGDGQGIYARVFDASGLAQTNEFLVNTTTAGDQGSPNVAMNDDGDFIITWYDANGLDGSGSGVFAQQFDRTGTAIGTETQINTTTTGSQEDATVAYSGNDAVIVWSGNGSGDAQGIFAQRFAVNSVLTGPDINATSTSEGGLSINVDGGNNVYLQADEDPFAANTAITFEIDFSVDSAATDMTTLLSYSTATNQDELYIGIDATGEIFFRTSANGDVGYGSTTSAPHLLDGQRHSVAVTWDNTAGILMFYVDGEQLGLGQNNYQTGTTIDSGGTLVVGQHQTSPASAFDGDDTFSGTIYSVRLFDDVRSAVEIAGSYRDDLPHDEDGIIASWRFDNISSYGVVSETVNSNNLTVRHTAQSGFTASEADLTFWVNEKAIDGTVVGKVTGIDSERETTINSLLAANPNLVYSAETDKFYEYVDTGKDWTTALADAQTSTLSGVTGNLVTINSAVENQIVVDLMNANGATQAYIAASDSVVEGDWRWYEAGTAGELFYQGDGDGYKVNDAYENWDASNPNNNLGNQHYAKIFSATGLWDDSEGTDNQKSIIEYDADAVLDATEALTYTFSSETILGAFAIDGSTGLITVADGSLLDFDTNATHSLTVRTTDVDSNIHDETFTVSLRNLVESNNAPTDLSSGIEMNTDGGNDAFLQATNGGEIFGGLTEFTFETSFQIEAGSQPTFLSYASAASDNEALLFVTNTGLLAISVDGNVISSTVTFAELNDGNQHSLAWSWDNTNGDWAIYLDGHLSDSGTGLSVGSIIDGSGTLILGLDQDVQGGGFESVEAFQGTLYDARVWNEVRSAAEIELNYRHKLDLTPLQAANIGLVANWQMNGFNGSNEVVDIVTGNNLSIGHAAGAGFTASVPVDDLHVSENATAKTTVGYIVPSDPDINNDVAEDGLFNHAGATGFVNVGTGQTIGGAGGSWTVVSGDVDLEGGWQSSPLGGTAVGLDGFVPGAIEQTLATEAGRQYQVVFAFTGHFQGANVADELRVSADGAVAEFQVSKPANWTTASLHWEHRSFTFTATDAVTNLQFSSLSDSGGLGPVIGDVQVIEIPQAITTLLNNDPTLNYDAATGKFYRHVGSAVSWNAALTAAVGTNLNGIGGSLVSIDSAHENNIVNNILDESGWGTAWLGGSDQDIEGDWRWYNGATAGELFWQGDGLDSAQNGYYTNFAASQPDDSGGGDTIHMSAGDGLWYDGGSDTSYIIEWDASEVLSNYTFILTDNAGGRFAIDQSTGEVSVIDGALLDHETSPTHDIDVQITDAAGNNYADTMTITIDNGIEPTQSVPVAQVVAEDDFLTFRVLDGNEITVSDTVATTDNRLQVFISANDGILTLSQTNGLSILGGSDGSSFMTLQGSESDINAAFEGMTFTPDADFSGTVTLNMTTSLGADMLGHYTFEGGNAIDQSLGLSQNGTLTGDATTSVDAERGEVLSLDGDGDFVEISGLMGEPADITLAAWINANSADTAGAVVISLGSRPALYLESDGRLTGLYKSGVTTNIVTTSDTYIGVDWTHVALSINTTSSEMTLYVDGQVVESTSTVGPIDYTFGPDTYIGRDGLGSDTFDFDGLIDDAQIYSRALSTDEIAALAADQSTSSDSVAITVSPVDDAAIIGGDISYVGNEGDPVAGTMAATDVEGLTDSTYFTVSVAATNGTAAIDPASGAWTFTPTDPNWFGTDNFTVTVTDDLGGTTTQVVNITLANQDDTAVIGGDISFNGNEGDAVSGTMTATDVDGLTDSTYFTVTVAATNGTAAIDPASGAWTFTPTDPNWFGTDNFTVTVIDDLGGTTTQVVNITLANQDDTAVIGGDISFNGNEGDAVSGTMTATDVDGLTDSTYFTVTMAATNGTAAIDPASGAWTFTPTDPNWFGTDNFTVTVTDDLGGTSTQVVNITLANQDDAAVIGGDISFSGNEGDAVSGTMTATDVDGLTNSTYFTVSVAATNGTAAIDPASGAWTFTPTDPNWFGTDNFTVTVTDDLGGTTTQVVNITLANQGDAAVIAGDISFSGNEGDAVSGTMTATDVEGLTDGTYFTVTAAATNGTTAIDPASGAWTFTPTDPNWFGTDNFTVTVTDDLGGTTAQVVNITLANQDDAAVIAGDISFSGNEGNAVSGTMTATDVEGLTDGTYFTVTAAATNGTTAIDPASGAWTFTPTDPNWFGTDNFTVTVTDDLGGTTTQVVNVTLANQDDPAVITGDISFSGNEGDAVSGTMTATDVEGLTDGTYYTVTAAATNGTATIDPASGAWTFTPTDPNWFGTDNFTVTITDDLGSTTTQVVNISLNNVNDASVIGGDISFNGNEGVVVTGTMTATDVEGLTDGAYFTVTAAATNGTAAIDPASGAWTFTPTDPNWFGTDNFTVTVTDDLGGITTQVVNVSLVNIDDPTVIGGDINYSGSKSDTVNGIITATDIEGLTDGAYFTITSPATNGIAAIDPASGAWTFAPFDTNWFGNDNFTVTVTDDLGVTTTQVVNIALADLVEPTPPIGAANPDNETGPDEVSPTDSTDIQDNNQDLLTSELNLLEAVVAVASPSATDEIDPPDEDSDISSSVSQGINGVQPVDNAEDETEQAQLPERTSDRGSAPESPPPLENLLAVQLLLGAVNESDLVSQEDPYLVDPTYQFNLRRATQTMRDQMADADNSDRLPEKAADMALRVSGTTLSAGSLAWLLRGGGLFTSALTSVPTWQGFDPLPVLEKKRDSTKMRNYRPTSMEPNIDKQERDAGQILDSAHNDRNTMQHQERKNQQ